MSRLEIELGDVNITAKDKYLIDLCVSSILSGRLDQLKLMLADVDSSQKINSINKVHDALFKAAPDANRTIWDYELKKLKSDDDWIYSLMSSMIPDDEKEKIKKAKINKCSNIASLGSCFATNISKHLNTLNYKNTFTLRVEEAVNSPRLIDMYFNPDKVPSSQRGLWDARFGVESKYIIEIIPKIDIFILTFGVGWDLVDRNGDICLDLVSIGEKLTNGELNFRSPSIEEQSDYIYSCVQTIRKHNQNAPILVTLSPVPLSGFFGLEHVIRANAISKANLVLAIESAKLKAKYVYIPTYEVVTSIAPVLFQDNIWGEDGTTRHPNNELIRSICESFAKLL
jgi:hypothetical protein